jgi:hypothetical protein
MKTLSMTLLIVAAGALAACTTAERTATGAGVGAVVGGALSNSAGGVVAGALIGGFGTYIAEVADGRCQYRNSRGQIYTTRCHWL